MQDDLEQLNELYESVVMDHYRNPRHSEPLAAPDQEKKLYNPLCGDECIVQVEYDGARLAKVRAMGRGCAISQASGSIMAELLDGAELADAKAMVQIVRTMLRGEELTAAEQDRLGDMSALAGVRRYPVRIKCALLPWTVVDALAAAN